MTGPTGPTGPTVLLLLALCASSALEDNDILEVRYPQRSVTADRGSSVKLSCDALYDLQLCGLLRVAWYDPQQAELTDPGKYFTTVNETDDGVRRRRVVTEILHLTPKDAGGFQCMATCETGATGMGHYIYVTVGG